MINYVFIKPPPFFLHPSFIFVLFPRKIEWILVSGTAETQSGQFISECVWAHSLCALNLTPVNFGSGYAQILLSELPKQHRFLMSFSSSAFSLESSECLGEWGNTRHETKKAEQMFKTPESVMAVQSSWRTPYWVECTPHCIWGAPKGCRQTKKSSPGIALEA